MAFGSADLANVDSIFKGRNGLRDFWALATPFMAAIPRDPLSYQYGTKPSTDEGVHAMLHTGGSIVSFCLMHWLSLIAKYSFKKRYAWLGKDRSTLIDADVEFIVNACTQWNCIFFRCAMNSTCLLFKEPGRMLICPYVMRLWRSLVVWCWAYLEWTIRWFSDIIVSVHRFRQPHLGDELRSLLIERTRQG